ncbi:MAG: hypothetical protein M3333_06565 [Actinomycetota bacterium]|nr:hypothetical protein [Actinomycetota bacterium]
MRVKFRRAELYNWSMPDDELKRLRQQAKDDRKLIERAAQALAEVDRAQGLSNENADVLTALRIRLEGKPRASLEDLFATTADLGGGGKDLGDVLADPDKKDSDWPVVEEKKRDWPG